MPMARPGIADGRAAPPAAIADTILQRIAPKEAMARVFGAALSRAVSLGAAPGLPNPCSTLVGGDQGLNDLAPIHIC